MQLDNDFRISVQSPSLLLLSYDLANWVEQKAKVRYWSETSDNDNQNWACKNTRFKIYSSFPWS